MHYYTFNCLHYLLKLYFTLLYCCENKFFLLTYFITIYIIFTASVW